jgi:hypothetical protein
VVEHPRVADVIEAATDVALKNPLRTALASQHEEALVDSVGGRAFRSKTIGVGSAVVSAIGSSASRYNACMARSFIVGIPSGLNFPLVFGI